ncbi:kelch-like protein [Aquimarina brevivitae]|nr:kelch-like protein [Aquimarina brevivitae]
MKTIKNILLLLLGLSLSNCSSDDNDANNLPPQSFSLIGVTDGAIEVDVLPTFRWENAIDPEGQAVTYRILLDTNSTPQAVLSEGITSTSFTASNRLLLATQYYWRIEATDASGNTTQSDIYSFTTRNLNLTDNLVIENATFPGRRNHSSVVFDGKIWVIGGQQDLATNSASNDVWFSEDGSTWTAATLSAPFTARANHTSVVFDNKIWVIGGFDAAANYRNDVWFSSDGINWSEATADAPFSARLGHSSVVYDNKIWVISGRSAAGYESDGWYSTDGITWVPATESADFIGRTGHSTVVFDNEMWMICGRDLSGAFAEIWHSSNGNDWTTVAADLSMLARSTHSTVVFDNKLWLTAGANDTQRLNDIWYSDDGITWNELTATASFSARVGHSSVAFDNQIWVIGGYDGDEQNDVWAFD